MNNGDMPAQPVVSMPFEEPVIAGDESTGMQWIYKTVPGLSKREHFAAMAMQGLMANNSSHISFHKQDAGAIASMAIANADALLSALEEKDSE